MSNIVRKLIAISGAVPLALFTITASAGQATGTVSGINTTANTFMLGGKTYTAGEKNVVGLKVGDLMEGDKVRITFGSRDAVSGKSPINVMSIEKVPDRRPPPPVE